MKKLTLLVTVLFSLCGLTVACGFDARDYVTVGTTPTPNNAPIQPSEDSLSINDAWRDLEDKKGAFIVWYERRGEDIAKAERPISFAEGLLSSGAVALSESAGMWAGPFAPLATLGLGYLMKRRNDATPDEFREAKEASYNRGIEVGRSVATAVSAQVTKQDS